MKLKLNHNNEEKLRRAADILEAGGLVVYPTDTLYGLGCDALNEEAIKKVFQVKQRPLSEPLPIAVCSLEMMEEYTVLDKRSREVAARFLPGALTIVLQKKNLPAILTGGAGSVAVRMPDNKFAIRLVELLGRPVTTTSANIHNRKPPVSSGEVELNVDCILDAGTLGERIPSTILDLTGEPRILREGMIKREDIEWAMSTKEQEK